VSRARRAPAWALAATVLALIAGCGGGQGRTQGEAPPLPRAPATTLTVQLYFPAEGGLAIEERVLETTQLPQDQVLAIARALLAGPTQAALAAPLPPGHEAATCLLTADGVAYLDLRSPEGAAPPGVGSLEEMQIVYSFVNSITLNLPEARRVVLVWNGTQLETLGGHLDLTKPLAPLRSLVR
jgi:germination protein M